MKPSRRDVLKSIGAVGAAGAASTAPASAMRMKTVSKHPQSETVQPETGFDWGKYVNEDAIRTTYHDDAPHIPLYEYVGSIHGDDVCFWMESVCVAGGAAATLAKRNPWTGTKVALVCDVGVRGGCKVREAVQKATADPWEWIYVYEAKYHGRAAPTARFFMMPRKDA